MDAQRASKGSLYLAGLILAAALCIAAPLQGAQAHDFGGPTTPGNDDDDDEDPPCDGDPCCDGNQGGDDDPPQEPDGRSESPISFYDGSESLTVQDMTVGGVFPIHITRRYDSTSSYDSPLGYGWAFLHDRRLYEYPDNSVVIRHGCGTRDRYVASGGAYVSPNGGTLSTLTQLPDGSFEVKYLSGFIDRFDSQGRLTAHQDRQGNRHEYSYDPRGKLPLTGSSQQSVDPNQPMTVAYVFRLTRIDERAANGALSGRYVTFEYDETTGRITTATSNDGRVIAYSHDVTAGLTKGNLVAVTGLDGVVAAYGYTDPKDAHNLTSIVEAPGRAPIINTYDDQDRVIRQDEGTRQIQFAYQVPLTRTVVTRTIKDADGLNPYTTVTTYEFDDSGRITKIVDALGNELRYTYSPSKRLTRKEVWQKDGSTLALLRATSWTYDLAGHPVTESVTLASGETITKSWTYDHEWIASEQVVSTAAPAKIFRTEYTFFYGPDGRPINVQSEKRRKDDGSFQTTTYTYDSRNRLLTTTLPDGVQIVNEYTGEFVTRRNVAVSGVPLAARERRFEYDAEGRLSKEWDARNNLTQYGYDGSGRLVSVTNPLNEQTVYTYTGLKLTQIETGRTTADGEGQITRLIYDDRDRLIGVQRKNDSGAFVPFLTFRLDSEGQRLAVTDAENRTVTMSYDVLGRLKTSTDPALKVTRWNYDASGNRTAMIDALNRETRYEYDALNRLTATVALGITPNLRTEYSYDAAGNVRSVRDPEGHTTVYDYDALSRNTRVTQQLGQFVRYEYDARDRIDFVINTRGNKIDYDYEPWGGLTAERHYATSSSTSPLRTIDYAHDADGNVLSVTDSDVQSTAMYSSTYDALSRRYDETIRYLPGGDRVLQHRYDRFGNRRELTLQDGTAVVNSYVYNKQNQLASATLAGAAISLAHYANDDRQSLTLPNGVIDSFVYGASGPVQSRSIAGPVGMLAQFDYTYDDALNVSTQTDHYGVHTFGYDGIDRLTQALRPATAGLPNESYAYDGAGNREDPGNAALYAYDANNRITASPNLTYTFDADGNIATRSDGATFSHDASNRLRQFTQGATNAEYLYDGFGRRIRKTVNATHTWYLWDGERLLAEYDASGTRINRYGYLAGDETPTQLQDANGTYYVHTDHLATPRLVTSSSAQTVWRSRHEAFGAALVESDVDGDGVPVAFNLRFPGQYADAESGLFYNYARYYDARIGRYLAQDPLLQFVPGAAPEVLGNAPWSLLDMSPASDVRPNQRMRTKGATLGEDPVEPNVYVYVLNDPLGRIDPTGRQSPPNFCPVSNKDDDDSWDADNDGPCEKGCTRTYREDSAKCGRKKGPKVLKALCYAAAMEKYGRCLKGCGKNKK